ncbi:MAG TPA: aminotransferase class I/II-fold pyridoxal phosphate-dependent enzyme [Solirubrobacteraceae bacterium]|nr:aminotransferase class I/II-fold pyridoxal phosphate-dependent enzyme [Solirubrobacteraceae bacterium]
MPRPRTNLSPVSELAIDLDRDGGDALHRQIEASIRERIRSGALPGGVALPPTRALARELGVTRGVVVEAYAQLVAEGYLTSRSGGYTQVALTAAPPSSSQRPGRAIRSAPASAVDFGYGRANLAAFPRTAWLRSVRRVLTETADDRFGYLDGHGAPELRSALAAYLNRVRGTSASPETIMITNGFAQAVSLLLGVLAARGARTLAVEDPSASDDARPIAHAYGMRLVGVPVGADGIHVDAVARLDADLLILTPSHQWPTGGVLSPEARGAVIAWAQRTGALVLEDDYDAEYRYDRAPVGAIQGLDPGRVAYAGTASKTLAPGFRLGWIILPPDLLEPFAEAKLLADRGSPILDQLTFADFLSRGEFDRHLRRMRPVYRSRRDVLLDALDQHLPELEPAGIAAGLHLVAWLPDDLDEEALIAAAAREGVAIAGVSPYRLSPAPRGGLIFGYSSLNERQIRAGVTRLARAASRLRGDRPAVTAEAPSRRTARPRSVAEPPTPAGSESAPAPGRSPRSPARTRASSSSRAPK